MTIANQDYVKYMTQRIVKYMDTPKDQRKKQKEDKVEENVTYSNKWFGILPFAFRLFFNRKK